MEILIPESQTCGGGKKTRYKNFLLIHSCNITAICPALILVPVILDVKSHSFTALV